MRIRYSVSHTALTQPITARTVPVKGFDLDVFEFKTTDQNSRDMLESKFDVAEMSIATLTKAVERGLPLLALPVFTSGRRFVQSGMYLRRGSDVTSLDQLRGRSVGLPQYWITSCVWQRLALRQMHGIAPEDVRWVTEQPERLADMNIPGGVDCRLDPSGDLAALLRSGQIDACFLQGGRPLPPAMTEAAVPAYPDCVAAEREYYRRHGIFPAMHVTAINRDLADSQPDIVPALLGAYAEAKEVAYRSPQADWPLPPLGHDLAAMRELLGGEPWPYGIAANRPVIETFLDAARDQGLIGRRIEPEEIFVRNLPAEFR